MSSGQEQTGPLTKKVASLYWDRIDEVATAAAEELGFDFGRATLLEETDPEIDEYGCGMWGCAYPTWDERLAVKITADPSEAVIVSTVLDDPFLRNHPGIAYLIGIWELPEKIWWEEDKKLKKVYAILREDIRPIRDFGQTGELKELEEDLNWIRLAAMNVGAARKKSGNDENIQSAIELYDFQVSEAEKKWRLAHVVDFMIEFERSTGAILADLHAGNVGLREHYNDDWIPDHPLGRHGPSDIFTAFDLGHSDITMSKVIPRVMNPGRIPRIC